ncbi:MAG: PulJ/GspJ family protein [Bacillota bacterium]
MNKHYLKKEWIKIVDNKSGFTLVELVVAIALLGTVLAGLYQFMYIGQRTFQTGAAESRAVQDARLALIKMENQVRQAVVANSDNPVQLVSSTQIRIYTDIDNNGLPERVTYRYVVNGTEKALKQSVVSPINNSFPYSYPDDPVNDSAWTTVIPAVDSVAFSVAVPGTNPVNRLSVTLSMNVNDSQNPLNQGVALSTNITVRSK